MTHSDSKGSWGRVVATNSDGTPFVRIKNEHLIKKRKSIKRHKSIKILLLSIPWFIFTIAWNYIFPEASPFDDVFMATCLYFFSRSFIGRFFD